MSASTLLDILHLRDTCPPEIWTNQCSLWFGTAPISPERPVQVSNGHAYRLFISRGIWMNAASLMELDDVQLRRILQQALLCDVHVRPPEPSFVSSTTVEQERAGPAEIVRDGRPDWILALQPKIVQCFQIDEPNAEPIAWVTVWYVNCEFAHHCTAGRNVKVSTDSFMWRTDFIFAWRDALMRASAADVTVVDGMPCHLPDDQSRPHVILSQGLLPAQHPILVTVRCSLPALFDSRQFAHVFATRVRVDEVVRLARPANFQHLSAIVQFAGRTYLPGEELLVQAGNHLIVICSSSNADPFTEEIVDGFNLLQRSASRGVRSTLLAPSVSCKPASFDEDTDLPMTFEGSAPVRARRPSHDGVLDWMDSVVEAIRMANDLDPWTELATMQVVTWYVHHENRPACRRSRVVRLTGEVITWIDDLRIAWIDVLDRRTPFSIHIVRPRPPQFRQHGAMLHLLLTQGGTPQQAAVVLTAPLEGFPVEGFIQGAFSVSPVLTLEDAIRMLEVDDYCVENRCYLAFQHQLLPAGRPMQVNTGMSLRLHIEPLDDEHPPFAQLSLLQVSTKLARRRLQDVIRPNHTVHGDPTHADTHERPPPDFVHSLFDFWQDAAVSWGGEAHSTAILMWFLDARVTSLAWTKPRRITLYDNVECWEALIRHAWSDAIDDATPLHITIVEPTPEIMKRGVATHIIVTRYFDDTKMPVLVSCCASEEPLSFALALPTNFTSEVIQQIALQSCNSLPANQKFEVHFDQAGLSPGSVCQGRKGAHIALWPVAVPEVDYDVPTKASLEWTSSEVSTWFLHGTKQPICHRPRRVLADDNVQMQELMRGIWFDIADASDFQVLLVQQVNTGERHLIGIQAVSTTHCFAALLEACEVDSCQRMSTFRAALLSSPLQLQDIGQVFGIDFHNASAIQRDCCECIVNDILWDLASPVHPPNGTFISLRWQQRQISSLPLTVDFGAVIRVFEELDAHFILPRYDLPPSFPWHPDSWEWTQLPWWTPGDHCHELIIYYDGSCRYEAGEQSAGCAVAAFVQTSGYWFFAGAVSTQLSPHTTSYAAELASSILAHKFAFDLLKIICGSQPDVPQVGFRYDSLTVGKQADGSWQIWSQPRMGHFLRSLHRCIESRFGVLLAHQHVKAHVGEPGNELVDCLAYQAAAGAALHDLQPWLQHVTRQEFVNSAEWTWYLFRSDLRWVGQQIVFPAGPDTIPDVGVFPAQLAHEVPCDLECQGTLNLKLATCNVLSLKPGKPGTQSAPEHLTVGPSRQDSLLAQFDDEGVHIFAWQETRLRKASNRHDERYWLFRSPANAQGHYGMLIGIHRTLPIGIVDHGKQESEVFIQEHEVAVVATTPRFMILRIKNPLLRCLVIAGHAPHTGAEPDIIRDWWHSVASAIPAPYSHWQCILLVDANARIGAEPNAHVGDHQAEALDPKAEGFLEFLSSHGLWIPATFSEFHTGLGATWRHARGQWFRNDFVCIPTEWQPFRCQSWVSETVDAGLVKEDHRAAVVHVCCHVQPYGQIRKPRVGKLHLEEIDWAALDNVHQPGWSLDVHSHAAALQESLVENLWPLRVKPVRRPTKPTMSDSTWQLVKEKRECRNLLHERSNAQRLTILQAWFSCWKHVTYDCPLTLVHQAFDDLIVEQDRLIAVGIREFRRLGALVTRALRDDDIQFYASLLADCKEFLQPADVKQLWGVVRRSLPKFQQRRMTTAPFQLEALESQWLPHYEELEAGVLTSPSALISTVCATSGSA